MKNFGTKPNGKMEALVGHDDDVISLAIGNQTLDMATPWFEVSRPNWEPPDLRGAAGVRVSPRRNTFGC